MVFSIINIRNYGKTMYLVERIGQLVLVTLEGLAEKEDVESIKKQLKEINNKDEELVVSLSIKSAEGDEVTPEMQKCVRDIVDFCKECEIRLYSYEY